MISFYGLSNGVNGLSQFWIKMTLFAEMFACNNATCRYDASARTFCPLFSASILSVSKFPVGSYF